MTERVIDRVGERPTRAADISSPDPTAIISPDSLIRTDYSANQVRRALFLPIRFVCGPTPGHDLVARGVHRLLDAVGHAARRSRCLAVRYVVGDARLNAGRYKFPN